MGCKKILAQIVTDVVNLEDISYTVPEVQALLDGITVGGHKIQDKLITLNQIQAWRFLFESIENNTFEVSKEFVLKLHTLVANQESLTWGEFRNGMVSISGTNYIPPKPSNTIWNELELETNERLIFKNQFNENAVSKLKEVDTYIAAINLFAKMARTHFFFDGNKRTGRMMMSGILLVHGYPMINVPAKRKVEFNKVMIDYYNSEQFDPIHQFLISCLHNWVIEEFDLKSLIE
jgi:Fic family protein